MPATSRAHSDRGPRLPSTIVDNASGKKYRPGNMLGKVGNAAVVVSQTSLQKLTASATCSGRVRHRILGHLHIHRGGTCGEGGHPAEHQQLKVQAEGAACRPAVSTCPISLMFSWRTAIVRRDPNPQGGVTRRQPPPERPQLPRMVRGPRQHLHGARALYARGEPLYRLYVR